ncbi:MAG: RNA-binding S4 domain-containing protein [Crocinitomicaceae bacterium]
MTELTFELKEGQPYIELNKVLQILKLAQTGGHAKILIQNEEVKVNGQTETRVRNKLVKGDLVECDDKIVKII